MIFLTDILKMLRESNEEIETLIAELEAVQARVNGLADDIQEQLEKGTPNAPGGTYPTVNHSVRGDAERKAEPKRKAKRQRWRDKLENPDLLESAAQRGVRTIHLCHLSNGACRVSIGDVETLLPQRLARLFETLCSSPKRMAEEQGELIPWKSWGQVEKAMGKKRSPDGRHSSISRMVHDLRGRFARAGGNPFLVQTDPRRGLRIALKSKGEVIEEDRG